MCHLHSCSFKIALYGRKLQLYDGLLLQDVSKVALSCWFDFSRQNPFQLIVALSSTDEARGGLFYDDGESLGKRWPALKN